MSLGRLRSGEVWYGKLRRFMVRHGYVWQGKVRPGSVGLGQVRYGAARKIIHLKGGAMFGNIVVGCFYPVWSPCGIVTAITTALSAPAHTA